MQHDVEATTSVSSTPGFISSAYILSPPPFLLGHPMVHHTSPEAEDSALPFSLLREGQDTSQSNKHLEEGFRPTASSVPLVVDPSQSLSVLHTRFHLLYCHRMDLDIRPRSIRGEASILQDETPGPDVFSRLFCVVETYKLFGYHDIGTKSCEHSQMEDWLSPSFILSPLLVERARSETTSWNVLQNLEFSGVLN